MTWRPMCGADLPAVNRIAARLHPDYPEAPEVFAERLALFPAGCAVWTAAETVQGYAVAHAARTGRPPCLDSCLGSLPPAPDCLHLHDIALLPAGRGHGAAAAWLAAALPLAVAHGLARLSLIAIAGKDGYWRRHGFRPFDGDADLALRLASYGDGALYMTRPAEMPG